MTRHLAIWPGETVERWHFPEVVETSNNLGVVTTGAGNEREPSEAQMEISESTGQPAQRPQHYRCFLLRCRLEENAGPRGEPAWRFTVQEAGPGAARRSFAYLKDVEAYLEAELEPSGARAAAPSK